jgi:hypothetical protein
MNPATAAHELRDARLALELSQGQVARDTRIPRSQIALFEGRKYLLDRDKLARLKAYYAKRGYRFEDVKNGQRVLNPKTPPGQLGASNADPTDIELLDGFAVASGIEPARAEAWLGQIVANDEVIQDLLEMPAPTDFWTGDPKTDNRDEALLQMARNYALVRRLHGKEVLPPPKASKDKTPLTGDLVRELFWGKDHSDNAKGVAKMKLPLRRTRKAKR